MARTRHVWADLVKFADITVNKYCEDGEHAWFVESVLTRVFVRYETVKRLQEASGGRSILTRIFRKDIHPNIELDKDPRVKRDGKTLLHGATAADDTRIVKLCVKRFGTGALDDKNRSAEDLAAPKCESREQSKGRE